MSRSARILIETTPVVGALLLYLLLYLLLSAGDTPPAPGTRRPEAVSHRSATELTTDREHETKVLKTD